MVERSKWRPGFCCVGPAPVKSNRQKWRLGWLHIARPAAAWANGWQAGPTPPHRAAAGRRRGRHGDGRAAARRGGAGKCCGDALRITSPTRPRQAQDPRLTQRSARPDSVSAGRQVKGDRGDRGRAQPDSGPKTRKTRTARSARALEACTECARRAGKPACRPATPARALSKGPCSGTACVNVRLPAET